MLLTARELKDRGHHLALLYQESTGKAEQQWFSVFEDVYRLTSAGNLELLEAILERFDPDLLFIHSFDDLEALEALLETRLPTARMSHDHALYCLRQYKYNYFTRAICTRPASGYCVFPCLATLRRNREGKVPVKLTSYSRKLKELSLNRRCDRVFVYSEYCRRELARNGFNEANIHLFVPLQTSEADRTSSFSERNLVLFAGQIIRGKGVDVLLRALKKVRVPFECVILGEGSHRRHCERLSSRLGLTGKVRFEGYVPHEQMRGYYLEASVFAISSVWPEPFGLVGPEAMRYGLPVVGFDAGGIKEWLLDGENGFLVPWMDTDAYAARIGNLLLDKTRARAMGAQGRSRVLREYELSRQVTRLESILSSLIEAAEKQTNENAGINVIHGNR